MIDRIKLEGFKGAQSVVDLSLPMPAIITGRNGSGKSTILEGVAFALSGGVPTGKTQDEVQRYMSPEGGDVTLYDDSGNWIHRGMSVSRTMGADGLVDVKRSKIVESSAGSDWEADPVMLDLNEFVSASDNKRREYILTIAGSGESITGSDLRETIGSEFAREICFPSGSRDVGDRSSIVSLDLLDDESRHHILSDEMRSLVECWPMIWECVDATTTATRDDETASQTLSRVVEESRKRKNSYTSQLRDSRAAMRALEQSASGARAAADEHDRNKRARKIAEKHRDEVRTRAAVLQTLKSVVADHHECFAGLRSISAECGEYAPVPILARLQKMVADSEMLVDKWINEISTLEGSSDLSDAESRFREWDRASMLSETAMITVRTYERARDDEHEATVWSRAWTLFESAARAAREKYLSDIVSGLANEINEIMPRSIRETRTVFVSLVSDRGSSVFDLGWITDTGDRRTIESLSGGESALFCAALSVVVAKRAEGRSVVLIESDSLDDDNFENLLEMIRGVKGLDCCVIARATTESHEGIVVSVDDRHLKVRG